MFTTLPLLLALTGGGNDRRAGMSSFRPGEPWWDTDGNTIDAHGAGLLVHEGKYYW